eukprot:2247719-Amphidinium_carterae.1
MRAAATQSLDSLQYASERVLLEEGLRRFTCQGHVVRFFLLSGRSTAIFVSAQSARQMLY